MSNFIYAFSSFLAYLRYISSDILIVNLYLISIYFSRLRSIFKLRMFDISSQFFMTTYFFHFSFSLLFSSSFHSTSHFTRTLTLRKSNLRYFHELVHTNIQELSNFTPLCSSHVHITFSQACFSSILNLLFALTLQCITSFILSRHQSFVSNNSNIASTLHFNCFLFVFEILCYYLNKVQFPHVLRPFSNLIFGMKTFSINWLSIPIKNYLFLNFL